MVLPVEEVVAAIELLTSVIIRVSGQFQGRRSVESGGSEIMVKLHGRKSTADLVVVVDGDTVTVSSVWFISTMHSLPKVRPRGDFHLSDPDFLPKFEKLFYEFFDAYYNPLKRS